MTTMTLINDNIFLQCDELSGCVQCKTEDHVEAESDTWQREASEPEK